MIEYLNRQLTERELRQVPASTGLGPTTPGHSTFVGSEAPRPTTSLALAELLSKVEHLAPKKGLPSSPGHLGFKFIYWHIGPSSLMFFLGT